MYTDLHSPGTLYIEDQPICCHLLVSFIYIFDISFLSMYLCNTCTLILDTCTWYSQGLTHMMLKLSS